MKTIHITVKIKTDLNKAWDYYVNPEHITNWNFADPSWHCPSASNDLRVGGQYITRMEAKDGSFGFDFTAIYDEIKKGEYLIYTMNDGRKVQVNFLDDGDHVQVSITFDAESDNSYEMQKNGWQAILDNFAKYTEENYCKPL